MPTVKVAEMVGYGSVAELAKRAGLPNQIGTPSIALGSYDATPIEMAGAYTAFTNRATTSSRRGSRQSMTKKGSPIYEAKIEKRKVMDPRVAYLMINMMEEVIRSGTAAGVRSRGFALPAAGKTTEPRMMVGSPDSPQR